MKMSVSAGTAVRCGALLGFLAVGLGAFGAHALKEVLEDSGTLATWKTAVQYHLVHAVVVAGLGFFYLARDGEGGRVPLVVSGLFTGGVILFSGSLYWLALGGPKWLGPVTPLGGLCFLVGWLWLVIKPSAVEVAESSR
ncbi:MAG: DUF423 domain-containing protein [Verrucomicrobiales bacterium]|nr:DUF423 domain-containing protein [Verrucomicrobiales bacterium]